jgi:hypothetical protein
MRPLVESVIRFEQIHTSYFCTQTLKETLLQESFRTDCSSSYPDEIYKQSSFAFVFHLSRTPNPGFHVDFYYPLQPSKG